MTSTAPSISWGSILVASVSVLACSFSMIAAIVSPSPFPLFGESP